MSGETTQRRLVQEDSNGVLLNKIVLSLRNGSSNPALSGFRSFGFRVCFAFAVPSGFVREPLAMQNPVRRPKLRDRLLPPRHSVHSSH
jgi:hypothetical protein